MHDRQNIVCSIPVYTYLVGIIVGALETFEAVGFIVGVIVGAQELELVCSLRVPAVHACDCATA